MSLTSAKSFPVKFIYGQSKIKIDIFYQNVYFAPSGDFNGRDEERP
jgi:hypothetical protein